MKGLGPGGAVNVFFAQVVQSLYIEGAMCERVCVSG